MAKGNSQKKADGSALDSETQLWVAAQAVPASHQMMTEYNGARPEGLCLGLSFRSSHCSDGVPPSCGRAVTDRRYRDWPCASTTTWKLARMNLAIRGFSLSASNGERVGVRCRNQRNADSFRADLHPDLKAEFVPVRKDLGIPLHHSSFRLQTSSVSDWGGENLRQDVRCVSLSASIGERAGVRCRSLQHDERKKPYAVIECKADGVTDAEFNQAVEQACGNGTVAQASAPAGCGSVPLPVHGRATYRGGTPLEPAAGTAALRSNDIQPVSKEALIGAIKKCHQTLWAGGKLSLAAVL